MKDEDKTKEQLVEDLRKLRARLAELERLEPNPKRVEEALREREHSYRSLLFNLHEDILVIDRDFRITDVNNTILFSTGHRREEVIGRHCYEVSHGYNKPCEKHGEECWLHEVFQTGKARNSRHEHTRTDGSKVWVDVLLSPLRDEKGNITHVIEAVRDVTDLIQAEEALRESEKKLRVLSSHLLTAQEAERRRISLELHDQLGQDLIVLKLQLKAIEKRLRKDQRKLRDDFESILKHTDQMVEDVRRLSRDLSPSLLEEHRLSAALRWLIDDFIRHTSTKASLDIGRIDSSFSRRTQIIIYRIFQEALTNIAKHAQATHVSVAIKEQDGSVSFSIADNGKGFDVRQVSMRSSPEKGIGLAAMEERALMVGGSLRIWSQDGRGTRISLNIPISEEGD